MTGRALKWEHRPASALTDAAVALEWNRLNATRGNLAFMDSKAVLAAMTAFGTGRERLWIGRDGPRAVAMFVLQAAGLFRWSTFQPSQLPLGSWVASPAVSLETLAQQLQQALPACLVLSVTQIDPLFAEPHAANGNCTYGDYLETGWLDIAGSFDTYWAARGKNLRQNMRKQRNKLAADGVTTHMRVWRDPGDMAAALQRYGALETAGWKANIGTAVDSGTAQGRFYAQLMQEAAAEGEAVVYEYLFDDRTVAMNLCLLRDGKLVVLKTAYDESIKSFSPAFLLREEELKTFFFDGEVRRVEYYGRLMDWHTKLTDNRRMLHHLTCYRWGWLRQWAVRRRLADVRPTASASQLAAPTTQTASTTAVEAATSP